LDRLQGEIPICADALIFQLGVKIK
jgi:hypothetical protein